LRSKVLTALPFMLTGSQEKAMEDIADDMSSEHRMLRLLQGDVGSGKTVVALMAMLTAVEAGRQAVLMSPTEILAQQHFATIAPLAEAAGVECVQLTGRDKGKSRTAPWNDWRQVRCRSLWAPMRCFRTTSRFVISRSPLLMNNIDLASTTGCCSLTKEMLSMSCS